MSDLPSIPAMPLAVRLARALADSRLGAPVALEGAQGLWLAIPAEIHNRKQLVDYCSRLGGEPDSIRLILPSASGEGAVALASEEEHSARGWLEAIAKRREEAKALPAGIPSEVALAALALAKQAGLLPVAWLAPVARSEAGLTALTAEEALRPRPVTADQLELVSEASLPLEGAPQSHIRVYRERFAAREHVALAVAAPGETPLVRVHSSCLTGDLLGSLRCDCGSQLARAIRTMVEAGGGVLLYINQEGRGIGIANKIRAYTLQDQGKDTVEANLCLGFAPDERDYSVAASMLKLGGYGRVRLLTNNPAKRQALQELGIVVAERLPLPGTVTAYNSGYLRAKAEKFGHQHEP